MNKEQLKKIESFKDIEFEKERLRLQIELSEERINNSLHSLTEKLTLDSIVNDIKESAIGRAYSIFKYVYAFFTRNKEE